MLIRPFAVIAITGFLVVQLFSNSQAQGVITIDLSYKIVLNPINGTRPSNGALTVADADIDRAIAEMNNLYESYFRGYRFRRVQLREVGGRGDFTGPSIWFNTNFFDLDHGSDWKEDMEDAAKNDSRYAWNEHAINIYITNGINGGICSFVSDEIVIIGGGSAEEGRTQLHELGHYFGLYHTQGHCNCVVNGRTGECNTEPGDDEIDDTLPDLSSWNQDGIANWNFRNNYASLPVILQNLVDNVFFNVMSYHGSACGQGATTVRLTERQLDEWADVANADRENVRSGRSIFVATDGGGLFATGSPIRPYGTIEDGVDDADHNGSDILMIRPGAYNESLRIRKPITLRATRVGPVIIGTSRFSTPMSSVETIMSSHTSSLKNNEATVDTMSRQMPQALPKEYTLQQNYPNPFNPETMINYQLPQSGVVQLMIYDMLGRSVRTLVDREQEPGYHQVRWDGRDNNGHRVASGVYFYHLKAAAFQQTRKMTLLP